ncbi:hypothetical protein VNO78_06179 [Psophocarpus tetragonolobus]|uniref:Uncharacterized protein n=1 Tax=Psophocarpus tetragonolobus TaxID=3891 RepID=A0AAN9STV2_PSOTE
MDVKGITWVGNMYQKFENMFLEAEDVMYEDAVKYIENQMQAVGESVKKIYSDLVEDLLPPNKKVGIELPIDKHADSGFCKKPFYAYKERHVKVKPNIKQTTEDSRIDHDVTLAASFKGIYEAHALFMPSLRTPVKKSEVSSPSTQYVGRMKVKSNLGFDENPVKEMPTTKITNETTLAETNACRTSQSCEISNENQIQNHGVSISTPASAEVTGLASDTHCSNEIENASTKQFPNDPLLVNLAEEKQIGISSSYCVSFGDAFEQGHETMQQDDQKLEEACVMVNADEIQLPAKAGGSLNTNKKKTRQPFSLSKKSARKQEYKELAAWHMKNEEVSDCMEKLDPTSQEDQKKLLLSSTSEPEWELL